jgi:hypothetical protein
MQKQGLLGNLIRTNANRFVFFAILCENGLLKRASGMPRSTFNPD